MTAASSDKNPSGVHFPVHKRFFGAANLLQSILPGSWCKGGVGAFRAFGEFIDSACQAKEPLRISLGVENSDLRTGQLPQHPLQSPLGRGSDSRLYPMGAAQHLKVELGTSLDLSDPRLCCACAGRLALICRSELYSNFNNIRVRCFILNGAPFAYTTNISVRGLVACIFTADDPDGPRPRR
jgi:hypothetical protein